VLYNLTGNKFIYRHDNAPFLKEGTEMYQQELAHIIVQSFKVATGKGPSLVKVNISENIIIADVKGALTTLEHTLIKNSIRNITLIKVIRKKILETAFEHLSTQLQEVTNIADLRITSFTTEIDYENDRQIIVFVCNKFLNVP
jgi:uncharacterized protein YbcI